MLLKKLSKQSKNIARIGGYDFGLTLDDRLIFTSLDSLYNKKPVKSVILATPDDESVGLVISTFNIKQDYAPMMIQGAGGLSYTYFDYDKKEYVTGTKTISDTNSRQLSDWSFIAEEHNTAKKVFDGGRDTNTPTVAESRITNAANSIQKITVNTQGDIGIHVADIIDIIIPSSEYSKTVVNEKYSGRWMVGKVLHNIDFDNKSFQSNLTLIRAGINGTELKGLVKTKKGKQIGK